MRQPSLIWLMRDREPRTFNYKSHRRPTPPPPLYPSLPSMPCNRVHMREMLPHLFLFFHQGGRGMCTYCHFSYAKHFVSAANLIICSILAPSDTLVKGVEVRGGSVEKRRPVLQSVQLNDFNARFFVALGTCHLARHSHTQLNCLHPSVKVSLCLSLPLAPPLWDFFTVAAFCNKYPKLQLATHTRAMVANYLASIFGSAEVVKNR